jgi:hypothetical protein
MAVKKATRSKKAPPKRTASKKATRKGAAAKRPLAASARKAKAAPKPASARKPKGAIAAKSKAAPAVRKGPAAASKRATTPRLNVKSKPPRAVVPPAEEADPVATAKLALGPEGARREETKHIPWSYGLDRVTAAAVDPDKLFVYWEVTEPAIERARVALGNGGPGAWLVLRVYDTTGLIFDGTNAHAYFDHVVDRATRQWFFQVGKPTSTAFVELGMKSTEGYFAKIARSARIDFPRREAAHWGDPEWMTVQPWSGEVAEVHRAPAPLPGPGPGPGPGKGAGQGIERGPDALPLWTLRDPVAVHEVVLRHLLDAGWERVEWSEVGGEGWFAVEGRFEWESPRVLTSWEAGPFGYPVEIEPPHREQWEGKGFAYRVGDVVHVVEGPWRVVIRNLGARSERELLGSWEIRRSWSVHAGRELRPGEARVKVAAGGSEQHLAGASERSWRSGSEVRLGGASERWRIGASEISFKGASERLYAGGSQLAYQGASERVHAAGSESRLGASDQRYEGGSSSPYPPSKPAAPAQEK